ncbi:MAG: hypothetical protein GEU88_14860 [Solirubrobacterales bacterium]|nr:hypothetical protein [Solirubrobacterales bacterium]
MGLHERKIREDVQPFLDPGEAVLAACIAAPRGFAKATVSRPALNVSTVGVGERLMGIGEQQRAEWEADRAGVRLAAPMAVVLTAGRLLTLGIGSPLGLGIGGRVNEVLSVVPIADVDSVEVQLTGLRKNLTLTVRGIPIELEANATASTGELAQQLERAKGVGRRVAA